MTLDDPTEIVIENSEQGLQAVGNIGFDDYFGGIGCFGTMEIAAREDWLLQWQLLAERDGLRCYSARETGETGRFSLDEGVNVEPYDTVFVLVELSDGSYTFADDLWTSTDDHFRFGTVEHWAQTPTPARRLAAAA